MQLLLQIAVSLLLLLFTVTNRIAANPALVAVGVIGAAVDIRSMVEIIVGETEIEHPLLKDPQRKVLESLKQVSKKIDETQAQQSQYVALAFNSVSHMVTKNVALSAKMYDIQAVINRISSRYHQMQKFDAHKHKLEMGTLISFPEWTVSPNDFSVHHLMDRLHRTLLGNEDASGNHLLSELADSYKDREEMCRTLQSQQQFVYALYTKIALAELKGYIMIEFSWIFLRLYGRGNFSQEAEIMRDDYEIRTERTLKLLKVVMQRSDRTLWRCDPPQHIPGVTYDQVTRLLQGYIENEVHMNTDWACSGGCENYQSARDEGCYRDEFCGRQPRCSGRIDNCQYVDSDMWVCPSVSSSTRRYEYIEYENRRVLGQYKTCTRRTIKVESWYRWLFWHCSYCFCLCDDQNGLSDRFFNLRESLSDVSQNKVVTGLRFVKKNRVFHLQIQEGQLLPRGAINESTLSWKPVDPYNFWNVAEGVSYHKLSYHKRSMNLGDITKKNDNRFIITGVRFRVLDGHLNLEARISQFDFQKGVLIQPKVNSVWQSNKDMGQQVNPDNTHVPTRTIANSLKQSNHNRFVKFTHSGMDADAAQTTVPFIDIQKVESNPPLPLAGVGLYYKGRPGYGGFVGPQIIPYDFTPHVHMPKNLSKRRRRRTTGNSGK